MPVLKEIKDHPFFFDLEDHDESQISRVLTKVQPNSYFFTSTEMKDEIIAPFTIYVSDENKDVRAFCYFYNKKDGSWKLMGGIMKMPTPPSGFNNFSEVNEYFSEKGLNGVPLKGVPSIVSKAIATAQKLSIAEIPSYLNKIFSDQIDPKESLYIHKNDLRLIMKSIDDQFHKVRREEHDDLGSFGWDFMISIAADSTISSDERTKLGYDKDAPIFRTNGEKIHKLLSTINPWPELLTLLKEHLKRIPQNHTSKNDPIVISASGHALSLQVKEKREDKQETKVDNTKTTSKMGAGAGSS